MAFRPVVLVVEDNPGDIELIRQALVALRPDLVLRMARDGEEALAILRLEGPYRESPRPDLIILDLNLPRLSGRDVLSFVKSDPELRRIPVVVMTTSGAEQDVVQSYELGANCYVTKPIDIDEFFRAVKSMEEFWLSVATRSPR